ncbi:MAG: DUF4838 domain-containing protein [bacterium]|nr:DUF4838 domain-containing protein [bacterium]
MGAWGKRRVLCWVAAIVLAGALGSASADVTIVQDGQPVARVVLPEDASQQVKDAAALLVSCVRESTGAELPLGTDADGETVIYVGCVPDGLDLDQAGLDDDGFNIAFPDETSVVVLGATDWGTEFGVCEFLERYVGVRWLLPGPDGTDIPKRNSIVLPEEPVRQEPAFFSRLFSGLANSTQLTWARRNRMRGRVSFHHNLLKLFPPETYTETHPEFFPMLKGERFLPPTNDTHHWQPCFTAPGIVDEAVANIIRFFDEHPEATSYSLGANDSSGYCECGRCLARISGDKNFLDRVDYSDLYYAWANQVIEGVLAKHPDKWFGCLAYSEVAAPPKAVAVHERLIPYMTYDRMKWKDPELRATGEDLTRTWHAQSPVLGWYDYIYGSPYCLPRVWFHHMGDYYRFGHANGVRTQYAEAYPNWGEGPKLYVSLKLQWDPTRDVDELLDEWYVRCVGADAAPYLARYYAHWEGFWTGRALESSWFSKGGQYLAFYSPGYLRDIDRDEIRQSREWLETTVAKAQTPKQKARAELILRAFEYYEATAYAYLGDPDAGELAAESEKQALALLDRAQGAQDYAQKRRELALDVFPNDPVLIHPLTITQYSGLDGAAWGGGTAVWQVFEWAANEGRVRDRLHHLAAESDSTTVRLQAEAVLAHVEGQAESLLKNPSFEDGAGTAAEGWSWWVKWATGTMGRSDRVSRTGSYSVCCDGMKRGGPVQVVKAEPGCYSLMCFVYVPDDQDVSFTATLKMALRDADGKDLASPTAECNPVPGRWTVVGVASKVPAEVGGKEVATILPILVVDGLEPGEQAYFDDLMLYHLPVTGP